MTREPAGGAGPPHRQGDGRNEDWGQRRRGGSQWSWRGSWDEGWKGRRDAADKWDGRNRSNGGEWSHQSQSTWGQGWTGSVGGRKGQFGGNRSSRVARTESAKATPDDAVAVRALEPALSQRHWKLDPWLDTVQQPVELGDARQPLKPPDQAALATAGESVTPHEVFNCDMHSKADFFKLVVRPDGFKAILEVGLSPFELWRKLPEVPGGQANAQNAHAHAAQTMPSQRNDNLVLPQCLEASGGKLDRGGPPAAQGVQESQIALIGSGVPNCGEGLNQTLDRGDLDNEQAAQRLQIPPSQSKDFPCIAPSWAGDVNLMPDRGSQSSILSSC